MRSASVGTRPGSPSSDQNELRFETARLFEDTSINALGFAVPGNKLPSFGLTIVSLRSGDFERTNELNDPLGTFQRRRDGVPASSMSQEPEHRASRWART